MTYKIIKNIKRNHKVHYTVRPYFLGWVPLRLVRNHWGVAWWGSAEEARAWIETQCAEKQAKRQAQHDQEVIASEVVDEHEC